MVHIMHINLIWYSGMVHMTHINLILIIMYMIHLPLINLILLLSYGTHNIHQLDPDTQVWYTWHNQLDPDTQVWHKWQNQPDPDTQVWYTWHSSTWSWYSGILHMAHINLILILRYGTHDTHQLNPDSHVYGTHAMLQLDPNTQLRYTCDTQVWYTWHSSTWSWYSSIVHMTHINLILILRYGTHDTRQLNPDSHVYTTHATHQLDPTTQLWYTW